MKYLCTEIKRHEHCAAKIQVYENGEVYIYDTYGELWDRLHPEEVTTLRDALNSVSKGMA